MRLVEQKLFHSGRMTLGLMMPLARKPGRMADVAIELAAAKRADQYGFAALWARSSSPDAGGAATLDDPFVWLTAIGGVAPNIALAALVDPAQCDAQSLVAAALALERMSNGRSLLVPPSRLARAAPAGAPPRSQASIQQLHLELLERADAPCEPLENGLRCGRVALSAHLEAMAGAGVDHLVLHLLRGGRPTLDVIDELGTQVLPRLRLAALPEAGARHATT